MTGPATDAAPGDAAEQPDFWQPGPGLEEFTAQPFAADDPEALPRRLGPLPDDPDGIATEELRRLYSVLADEAEREALGGDLGQ